MISGVIPALRARLAPPSAQTTRSARSRTRRTIGRGGRGPFAMIKACNRADGGVRFLMSDFPRFYDEARRSQLGLNPDNVTPFRCREERLPFSAEEIETVEYVVHLAAEREPDASGDCDPVEEFA